MTRKLFFVIQDSVIPVEHFFCCNPFSQQGAFKGLQKSISLTLDSPPTLLQ